MGYVDKKCLYPCDSRHLNNLEVSLGLKFKYGKLSNLIMMWTPQSLSGSVLHTEFM